MKAAAVSAAGLAGCSQNNDSGQPTEGTDGGNEATEEPSNELGERVPPVIIEYLPAYAVWEGAIPLIQSDIQDSLDYQVELNPVEVATMLGDVYDDQRTFHFSTWGTTSSPTRLDPGQYMRNMAIDYAGGNGQPNYANYASCEYSELVINQQTTGDPEERRTMLQDAMRVFSNDRANIPFISRDVFGAGRKDNVEFNNLGEVGISLYNAAFLTNSTPKSGNSWTYGTNQTIAETTNHLTETGLSSTPPWQTLIHSPLLTYDENWELANELASDYTVEENGTVITFELAEATFHNGDPITAEDVKFTLELLNEFELPMAIDHAYDSIEAVDDRTVVVTLSEPQPTFLSQHVTLWGILHKETWEGMEDPATFEPDPVVGSGPFELVSFTRDQSMVLAPHPEDGHPNYSPSHELVFLIYSDNTAKVRSLEQGEIDVAADLAGADLERLQNSLSDEELETNVSQGFAPWQLYPNLARAPVRFPEFMDALGMSLNRERINQIVMNGLAREIAVSCPWMDNHPYFPEDGLHQYTDDMTGDPEGARQALLDAGWGWDDDGNLRYPAGTDTSPLWPEGGQPSPDMFPCIDADGEYTG